MNFLYTISDWLFFEVPFLYMYKACLSTAFSNKGRVTIWTLSANIHNNIVRKGTF